MQRNLALSKILKHNYYHFYNEFAPKQKQKFLKGILNEK